MSMRRALKLLRLPTRGWSPKTKTIVREFRSAVQLLRARLCGRGAVDVDAGLCWGGEGGGGVGDCCEKQKWRKQKQRHGADGSLYGTVNASHCSCRCRCWLYRKEVMAQAEITITDCAFLVVSTEGDRLRIPFSSVIRGSYVNEDLFLLFFPARCVSRPIDN